MPCNVFGGSCSLCPWCGEEQCPHYHDHDNDKRYWIYATDRKESCHVLQANLNTKKEVIAFVKKLVNKKWGKNYKRVENIDGRAVRRNGFYQTEVNEVPWVEITITDGEYSWYDSVRLIINTDEKKIYYYNIWKTEFHARVDKGEETHVELIKEWDGKVNFIKMQELPWYPTPEEWEARRNGK